MCEVTYGVIVRCQWAFTHTTLTEKHSLEHSKPLMASNGGWHQSCHVSCYFSLFFLLSFRLELSAALWRDSTTWAFMWTLRTTLASPLVGADRFSRVEKVYWTDLVQYLPCLLSSLAGKRIKTGCQKRRRQRPRRTENVTHRRPSCQNCYSYLIPWNASFEPQPIINANMSMKQ